LLSSEAEHGDVLRLHCGCIVTVNASKRRTKWVRVDITTPCPRTTLYGFCAYTVVLNRAWCCPDGTPWRWINPYQHVEQVADAFITILKDSFSHAA
jgi:hypothetical protein